MWVDFTLCLQKHSTVTFTSLSLANCWAVPEGSLHCKSSTFDHSPDFRQYLLATPPSGPFGQAVVTLVPAIERGQSKYPVWSNVVSDGQCRDGGIVGWMVAVMTVVVMETVVVSVRSKFKSASLVPFEQESRLLSVMTPDLTNWNSSVIFSSSQSIGFGCSELWGRIKQCWMAAGGGEWGTQLVSKHE